jgi:hypothetical protein
MQSLHAGAPALCFSAFVRQIAVLDIAAHSFVLTYG